MDKPISRFRAFWPRNCTGLPAMTPCSLPAAISEPVVVRAPSMTSNPSAPRVTVPSSEPFTTNSPMPTRAAARAPKACESAVRCGMAVMGTLMAIHAPMIEPSDNPAMIHTQEMISVPTSVPTMAANIPASARNMPRRAVSGWDMPFSERTNRMDATR